VIDTATQTVGTTISGLTNPTVAATPRDCAYAYIANPSAGTVTVINIVANIIIATIEIHATIGLGLPYPSESSPAGTGGNDSPPVAGASTPALPITGTSIQPLIAFGLLMIGIGTALLVVNFRRNRRRTETS
ncbi:LPXTG cell wall anchor domain-containing protein, partial [Planosporangium flavigriseum]